MRGYDVYVVVASLYLAMLFWLRDLYQWKRFLEGKIDAIVVQSGFLFLFFGLMMAWGPVEIVYWAWAGGDGTMDGGTLLAGPEFLVWVCLLALPAGFLREKITTRLRPSDEKIKEMKQANDLVNSMIKHF